MSGFEIAGVVLGVLPLIINALEHYGEGIKSIRSMIGYRELVRNLVLDVQIEARSFHRGCEKLLSRLRISPEEVDELLKFPKGEQWNDPALDTKIQQLLGAEDYLQYKQLVLRLFVRLDGFSKKLGLNDDFVPEWMTDSRIAKVNALDKFLGKTTVARKAFKAIMLGFDRGEYAVDIMGIRNDVEKISSLVGDAIELTAPRRERSRRVNTKFWSSIRQYAESLFQSIRWQCVCASDHTVNLRLQIRENAKQDADAACLFAILFAFSRNSGLTASLPWIWRHAQVKPSEIYQAQVSGSVPCTSISSPPSPTPETKITSLCEALKDAPQESSCIGFLDHQQCRHHIFCSCEEEARTVMSLEQLLQETHMCRYSYGIKERYKLSATLASTVLQLCATPWLRTTWSKNDIYFIKGGETSLADQLYIRKSEEASNYAAQPIHPSGLRTWSNPSLFALALVLVELYFGRPLESIPSDPSELDSAGNPLPYRQTEEMKLNRLINGVDQGTQEKEAAYFQAIKRCLRCNFDTESLDLKNSQFQEVFYTDIIAPLESCYQSMI